MRLKQLYYLVEVYKNKSISLTSKLIYVSQPTISEALKSLENEVGANLFYRDAQGLKLTKIGEETVQYAEQILSLCEKIKGNALEQKSKVNSLSGKLLVYTVPTISHSIIPEVINSFSEVHANISIKIIEESIQNIINNIQKGLGDIGLITSTKLLLCKHNLLEGVRYEQLSKSKLYVYASKNSPISKNKTITFKEALKCPIVVSDFYEDGLDDQYDYGEPNIVLKSNNMETGFKLISEGRAIGFASHYVVSKSPFFIKDHVTYIPIRDDMDYAVGYIWKNDSTITPQAQEFLKSFKSFL
ncbi:transcriptional regulator [Desulfosporosinus orientis DSM 765]|uniref:Transcriptional regulator n=1 Tax=Desulfosporosinus orientis (strain ATCC 19365 / DSM 765 / NCIMB 8382 / VKM B-1628 / Singapore I) TaxID=768706 RepID=G7W656_DESOD|nr:LysR family transcriptional regulator [Desulfosporosinus orientis]AET67718.1 transcriptional regulator [Desulfosporosinus orientis DSM 765]